MRPGRVVVVGGRVEVAGLILNGVAREQAAKRRAARAAGMEPSRPFLELFDGWGE
ncbi:hypothetical protein ACFVKB_15530 [Rhodococcus sp. NPDC127530]|uniref:hypothetical protein n=1 Tax=unclassified Rhodococcus (in: high G+C Gram-positive bacteria) TaxID=192944 RepID=UPI003638A447